MSRNREQYNAYMRVYILRRYHERMAWAREELGGACVVCGATDDLDLDHIDPATKVGTVARIWSYSEARFRAEVSKCQLLCDPCHKAKHASTEPCGTVQRYWRGCRCVDCRAANTRYCREKKTLAGVR